MLLPSAGPVSDKRRVAGLRPNRQYGWWSQGCSEASSGSGMEKCRNAAPLAVGKHGLSVWPEQQSWLTPPLASTHSPALSVVTQAEPVHVAEQAVPPQLSSWVSPQGFGPLSVEVPVVRGSVMVTVPAGGAVGGQSDDSVYVVLPVVTMPSVRHACPAR